MSDAYLLYLAYHYYQLGEPFPVDVFIELVDRDMDPSYIEELFHEGFVPEFDQLIDPSEYDNNEL